MGGTPTYDVEMRDFPAPFSALERESLFSRNDLSSGNLDKIRRQLWRGNEEQMRKWVIPCVAEEHRAVERGRNRIHEAAEMCDLRETPEGSNNRPNDVVTMDVVTQGGAEKIFVFPREKRGRGDLVSQVFPRKILATGKAVFSALIESS